MSYACMCTITYIKHLMLLCVTNCLVWFCLFFVKCMDIVGYVCVCRYTVSVHLQSKASGIMLNTVLHSFSWSILEIFPCHLMEFLCFFQWLGSIPYFIDVPQSSQSPLRSHLNCFRILAQCCRVHPCTCDCSVSGSYRVLTRKLLVHQVCAHFNMCCQIVFQKVAPVLTSLAVSETA